MQLPVQLSKHPLWTFLITTEKNRGFSPQANYTDRATAACRRSLCQFNK
jgi:hypothetical protein